MPRNYATILRRMTRRQASRWRYATPMARDVILLGEVVARRATMIEIRCGRCDRHGRVSVARLMPEFGANTAMGHVKARQVKAIGIAPVLYLRRVAPWAIADLRSHEVAHRCARAMLRQQQRDTEPPTSIAAPA